jgi:predicted nucleic acid-binding protein
VFGFRRGTFDSFEALRHGLTLVTVNVAEFARVPHLKWQDWASPRQ